MPVYTRCSTRRGKGQRQRQRAANARQQQQQHSLKRATQSLLSLSHSQRNVDHFCFQYEIIDSAVDSGSEETRAHEQVLRPHTTSPLPPHCRKWSAARERAPQSDSLIARCSLALLQSTLLAVLCRLGALFGACLASLNNVISESVWRCVFVCVCVSQSPSASQSAALLQLTYFSVVQIQVYVREINFDFVSLRFVFMPMRGLHTHRQRHVRVCCMC